MKRSLLMLLFLVSFVLFGQAGKPEKVITDADITATSGNVFWSKDTVYVLDGFVYVEEPSVLTIQAGTVVKAKETPSVSDVASALIICRGAKIIAEGTRNEPIIFTTEYDDTDLPDDGTDTQVDFTLDRGLWGGLVLLGNGRLNVADEKVVEGLPATEPRAMYGRGASNFDDEDSSGVLRYVSIRYTGITVESNKELQGLTLGCVGSKTVIEYIESFCSDDDGYEWFGGTVNTKYLIAAYATDDGFDYDQSFRGKGQFWFAIQDTGVGDHIGEWDSGDAGALTNEPLSKPVIFNATFLGRGATATGGDDAIRMKEFAGGEVYNSIITDFDNDFVNVDSGAGSTCYDRFVAGQIKFENNLVYKPSSTWEDICVKKFMWNYMGNSSNNNTLSDPQLTSLSRSEGNNSFDPRPVAGGLAYTAPKKSVPDSWFTTTSYVGAFGDDLWYAPWSAIYQNNISVITSIKENKNLVDIPTDYQLMQNYPNPFNPTTNIQFALPEAGNVKLTIYNILGQEIQTLVNSYKEAGNYTITWNAENLSSGTYIYRLESNSKVLINKMTLLK
ncbi:MAG: T9SS type A sorting domain-containing protein [Ignavibacteriales bacterium]|nr:T9SS type A sorting domain-containing protein [Ignavibacteriales bacterium]